LTVTQFFYLSYFTLTLFTRAPTDIQSNCVHLIVFIHYHLQKALSEYNAETL
jgi:hypothetical protein